MKKSVLLIGVLACSQFAAAIEAETPESSCKGIMKHLDKEDYKGALNDARLCVELLEQKVQGSVTKSFSESVAGWERTSISEENVLGMANITAEYSKGDDTLSVSLVGGKGSGSGGAFGNALGSIATMGMMQAGGKRIRVQGLAATVTAEGEVIIQLDDGAFVTVSSPQYSSQDTAIDALESFLDAFPFAEINKARS